MIKRTLAVLAMLLVCNHAAPAQTVKPKPGATPGGAQPAAGGGEAAQPSGQPSQPGGLAGGSGLPSGLGGEGQAGGKKLKDPDTVFDFMAKGRDYFLVTESKSLREPLEQFLKERGITNGQVTRMLYAQFRAQLKTTIPGGAAMDPGMGGPVDGVIGGKYTKEKDLKNMTLEDLLAKALKDNPDVRVAESKVREAEANLNRARLEVLQKVARLQQEILLARTMLSAATEFNSQIARRGNSVSEKERGDARLMLERAKGELAKLEAELPYLVGKQPAGMPEMSGGSAGMAPGGGATGMLRLHGHSLEIDLSRSEFAVELGGEKKLSTSVSDKLHKALDTEVTLRQSDMTLHDAVSFLSDKMQGINVHISDKKLTAAKINMYFRQPVTLGAVFQFFEDELDCKCVIREYGIVIVQRDRVPPSAAPLLDFWKKSRAAESKPK